jgi:uncharacterized repeat protein (TIGR03833 family)
MVEEQKDEIFMSGTIRAQIKPGLQVSIVTKQDQRLGKLTQGVVKEILTNSPTHMGLDVAHRRDADVRSRPGPVPQLHSTYWLQHSQPPRP